MALAGTLVVGAVALALIVSQTPWFRDWLRRYIVRESKQYMNGELTIGRLGGNLFFGVELENVGVTLDGSEVVSVQDLGVDYSVFDFISKGMSIDDIRINKPRLYLRREGDTWSVAKLIKRQEREFAPRRSQRRRERDRAETVPLLYFARLRRVVPSEPDARLRVGAQPDCRSRDGARPAGALVRLQARHAEPHCG